MIGTQRWALHTLRSPGLKSFAVAAGMTASAAAASKAATMPRAVTCRMLRLLGQLGGLVLGEAPLEHRAREDADEPAVLDDRHPLEVVLLEEAERLVDVHVRADRVVRRLDDLRDRRVARVAPGGDHFADERLPRDDPHEPVVPAHE